MMKASSLLVSLTSILVLSACGSDASLGNAGNPVDTTQTGSGGSAGNDTNGSGGSTSSGTGGSISSSTGGSSGSTGGSNGTGTGGSTSGAGGSTSGGAGGTTVGDGGSDPCALVRCAAGTHCVVEQVVCIQAPCPPQATCVKDVPPGSDCTVDQDCRLFDNYCGGCACDALAVKAPDPTCNQGMVQCLVQPCGNKTAACSNGKCVAK